MKIGFIDLYLSEWHANHYPEWLKQACPDCEVAYAWAEESVSPVDGRTSGEWCEAFGVTLCKTAGEVCERSDAIIVLAPSDPQVHLRLAELVLPYGKPTYMDKTFAPDTETAAKIFALARKYKTPLFSTSALRYATETEGDFVKVFTTGGGRSAEEYLIHQAEMIVKILGVGAQSVQALPAADTVTVQVNYADQRQAGMLYGAKLPFALSLTDGNGKQEYRPAKSDYFQILMAKIAAFFQDPTPPVSEEETMEVMALRQSALAAIARPGEAVAVSR